ncbi:hypothetical protein [Rhodobacter calidifons]|uniref:Uncharacterized protein n=1 Tax=Rhodobacter calidifons TaxID=2715277 RepID=A0ABX0G5P5_9RHOB|nr:hypothetical protein [Rhodobacter calidifons]NHB76565.1 hypothetical protein [Rhodobacter calidifons]
MAGRIPSEGVLIRAENGDVIRYDETGLVLRLSDRVIADIAARLDLPGPAAPVEAPPLPDLPEDIDLWAPRREGDWVVFQANLPGADGPRGYRRHVSGGAIIAEARGSLLAILGIGGARAGLGSPGPARFPWHVLAPADDIGAVGMGGAGEAVATDALEPLRELTVEALIADEILARRRAGSRSLPLVMVRTETDMAASAHDLGSGLAVANLDRACANLVAAAGRLGVGARVLAVVLDYTLEDLSGDALAYRDGMIALMERITRGMAKQGLARPVFLAAFDCGTQAVTRGPALDGQWELSWNHADHQLVFAAPSYAFRMDDTGRLTDEGRAEKALLLAEALMAVQGGGRWLCPTIQLAERAGDDIRLICEAQEGLVIDGDDPFGAGPLAGFALEGVTNGARIAGVGIDASDPKAVILTCSARPEGEVFVTYAHAASPWDGPWPANRGALRGDFGAGAVRRWALPARLRLTG